jgi:hypothetical protein
MWFMTQERVSLARLAGLYGLKTAQGYRAAEKLGLNLKRGAAKVAPWQEALLRPELERMKREQEQRKYTSPNAGPVVYEAADDHSGYLETTERPNFPNGELERLLSPILKRMSEDEQGSA